jgi:hypothetical protein
MPKTVPRRRVPGIVPLVACAVWSERVCGKFLFHLEIPGNFRDFVDFAAADRLPADRIAWGFPSKFPRALERRISSLYGEAMGEWGDIPAWRRDPGCVCQVLQIEGQPWNWSCGLA